MKLNKGQRKKNETIRRKEGITLVALVITVIVMLILAGVSISALLGNEGLFSKTANAASAYKNAAKKENEDMQILLDEMDYYLMDSENPVVNSQATIGTIVTDNQTYDGRLKGTYNNPIIPKGFAPINENGATWGTKDAYKKGLVITDDIEDGTSIGNEFVWIPVDGTIVKFERYDFGKGNIEYDKCSEVVPTEITESIINNGGYYIARYEAGIATNMPQEKLTSATAETYGDGTYKPVSKKGIYVWDNIIWGTNDDDTTPGNGAVTVARSMYSKDDTNYGVISTLIYGTQWDTTLKFIGAYDVGEKGYDIYAINSTGMGNYKGTGEGDPSAETPDVTGAYDVYRQKNIYDMAGNVREWTMEKSNRRISRGDDWKGDGLGYPASYRHNNPPLTDSSTALGFRVALYISDTKS